MQRAVHQNPRVLLGDAKTILFVRKAFRLLQIKKGWEVVSERFRKVDHGDPRSSGGTQVRLGL